MQWLSQLFFRARRYRDLKLSIQEHLDEKMEELMDSGLPREEAERTARREFGNTTLIEEESREIWQWPRIESVFADIRFALRQLRTAPGYAATAVSTLSLGIAVNVTMFSLVSAFLLPRLPGQDPQRVVVLSSVNPEGGEFADTNPVSVPNYLAWRNESRLFKQLAAADDNRTGSLTWQKQPESIHYAAISANYFSVFGSTPALGRSFTQEEEEPGHDHVLILSHSLWERRFASNPSVIGQVVRLNRENYTVVGVMGASFHLLGFTPQLWTPLVLNAADKTPSARKNRFLYLFARLAPGVTLERARSEIRILAKRAETEYPETETHWQAALRTLPDYLVYAFGIRPGLAVLMTAVGFVLLIACANVAGLFLTRALGRQKELAIRTSLGAGRTRIVRQLMTEGLIIAALGGGVGVLLAYFAIQLVRANMAFNEAVSAVPITLDRNVLLFAVGISLLSAVLSTLIPAIRASLTDVNADLKSESRSSSSSRSKTRLRAVLVTGQVTLALFLLIGTCLLIRSVFLLDHQQLGFTAKRLLTGGITLDHVRYGDAPQQLLFTRRLTTRLQQLPGVESVAVASILPATGADSVPVHIQGRPKLPANEQISAINVVITPNYFHVTGIPLLRGRTFTEMDRLNAPPVVLVNQEFVRRNFRDQDPLGKQIQISVGGSLSSWSEIVGVVGDVKSYSEETRVDSEIYESFYQRPLGSYALMLRSTIELAKLAPALFRIVAQLDNDLPLSRVLSMESVIDLQRNGKPFFTRVLGVFALLALGLAAIGVYGLIAYSVTQRTQEFGIRMALGATGPDIRRLILRSGFTMTAVGSALGFLMALPLPKLLDAIFPGMHSGAPILYVIVLVAMLLVCAWRLTSHRPALRALVQ